MKGLAPSHENYLGLVKTKTLLGIFLPNITSHLESILHTIKLKQVSFINQSQTKITSVLPTLTWKKKKKMHCSKGPEPIPELLGVAQTGKENKSKREN